MSGSLPVQRREFSPAELSDGVWFSQLTSSLHHQALILSIRGIVTPLAAGNTVVARTSELVSRRLVKMLPDLMIKTRRFGQLPPPGAKNATPLGTVVRGRRPSFGVFEYPTYR
jgi:hypothetical protein